MQVALEPWSETFWAECEHLAKDHFAEVDGGVEPKRKFRLDRRLMQALDEAGALLIVAAREDDGQLVGYYSWQITPDVESQGLRIAQQGAWYVAPGHPKTAYRMFALSVLALRKRGVDCIYPHHRLQGRGSHLGRFFQRQGAKPIQVTYSLWIAD